MARKDNAKRYAVALAVGAASIFLPQWDPDDHWATAGLITDIVVVAVAPDEPGWVPGLSFVGPTDIESEWI